MENEEKKDEKGEKDCCSGKGCSCGCCSGGGRGGKGCCGCKAVAALVLLVVGGLIGFFVGHHCSTCPLKAAPAAVQAPAK